MKKISDEQIKIEAQSGFKPQTIESGIALLPFSELSDREFELLSYLLIKEEIEHSNNLKFDNISLMQGVSDRGRDCVLYSEGQVCGLVQCKKYSSRLSRPQVIKEVIKFLLFATLDSSILPHTNKFEYKLYVSNDFSEPAINLINSYKSEISIEIQNGNVDTYIFEIVNEYESFKIYRDNVPTFQIKSMLIDITLTSANAIELSARVNKYHNLLSLFFNVKRIVDLEKADSLFRDVLSDFGFKYLTDTDLKKIQERIGNVKEDNRINLGVVDFFGYHVNFFKYLSDEQFQKVIRAIMNVQYLLNKNFIEFILTKINEFIFIKITNDLLKNKKIHPFSIGIASPYLFERLSIRLLSSIYLKSTLSDCNPQYSMTKEELVKYIARKLFKSSERVMNKDYSELTGTREDVEFKIQIFAHMHRGFNSIEDAKKVFNKDIIIMQPILDEIENEINKMFEEKRTIVINDSSFLNNKVETKEIINTLNSLRSSL